MSCSLNVYSFLFLLNVFWTFFLAIDFYLRNSIYFSVNISEKDTKYWFNVLHGLLIYKRYNFYSDEHLESSKKMQPTQNEDINHYEIKLFLWIYRRKMKKYLIGSFYFRASNIKTNQYIWLGDTQSEPKHHI